uniref:Uncharacterized protein n=1 Tax=Leersia perrieri TaxID=77586 RepID=A0A0D9WTY7_9ORYZ
MGKGAPSSLPPCSGDGVVAGGLGLAVAPAPAPVNGTILYCKKCLPLEEKTQCPKKCNHTPQDSSD